MRVVVAWIVFEPALLELIVKVHVPAPPVTQLPLAGVAAPVTVKLTVAPLAGAKPLPALAMTVAVTTWALPTVLIAVSGLRLMFAST